MKSNGLFYFVNVANFYCEDTFTAVRSCFDFRFANCQCSNFATVKRNDAFARDKFVCNAFGKSLAIFVKNNLRLFAWNKTYACFFKLVNVARYAYACQRDAGVTIIAKVVFHYKFRNNSLCLECANLECYTLRVVRALVVEGFFAKKLFAKFELNTTDEVVTTGVDFDCGLTRLQFDFNADNCVNNVQCCCLCATICPTTVATVLTFLVALATRTCGFVCTAIPRNEGFVVGQVAKTIGGHRDDIFFRGDISLVVNFVCNVLFPILCACCEINWVISVAVWKQLDTARCKCVANNNFRLQCDAINCDCDCSATVCNCADNTCIANCCNLFVVGCVCDGLRCAFGLGCNFNLVCCTCVEFYTFRSCEYGIYLNCNLTNLLVAIHDDDCGCANAFGCDVALSVNGNACAFANLEGKSHFLAWNNENFDHACFAKGKSNFLRVGIFVLEYLDCASFFHFANGCLDDGFALGNCCYQTVLVNCCNFVVGTGPNNLKWVFVAGRYC